MYARHIVPQRLFMMLRIIRFLPLSEQTLADAIIEFCTDMVLDFLLLQDTLLNLPLGPLFPIQNTNFQIGI